MYYEIPELYNALQRICAIEDKQTIWETKWLQFLLQCLCKGYIKVKDMPSLKRYADINHADSKEYRKQLHIKALRDYAFPAANEAGIIHAAIKLQHTVDAHQWLPEVKDQELMHFPETELRSSRRDLYSYDRHPGPELIDINERACQCNVIGGGWTHYLPGSKNKESIFAVQSQSTKTIELFIELWTQT